MNAVKDLNDKHSVKSDRKLEILRHIRSSG